MLEPMVVLDVQYKLVIKTQKSSFFKLYNSINKVNKHHIESSKVYSSQISHNQFSQILRQIVYLLENIFELRIEKHIERQNPIYLSIPLFYFTYLLWYVCFIISRFSPALGSDASRFDSPGFCHQSEPLCLNQRWSFPATSVPVIAPPSARQSPCRPSHHYNLDEAI